MADPILAAVFKRPFAEQVAFFRGKLGNLVPTARWDDLWKNAHDTAFMVAGAQKADLLADLAGAVEKAIVDGIGIGEFRKQFDAAVAKAGWSYTGERNWRTRVIYQTNISTSYAAGREQQIADGGFPYKMYKHSDSVLNPRPEHVSWDGLVLPVTHPFWQTHSAPNGWGCKCRIVGIRNEAAARRLGGKWGKQPPDGWDDIDAKTGEPLGIDKGWGYQPGASVLRMRQQIAAKAAKLPEPLASALVADVDKLTRTAHENALNYVVEQGKKAGKSIEFASVVANDGALVLSKKGGKSHVSFTSAEILSMRDATLYHNHPSSYSLSLADLKITATAKLKEIVAVGHDGTVYRASAKTDISSLSRMYKISDTRSQIKMIDAVSSGQASIDEVGRWHHHLVNTMLKKAGAIDYEITSSTPIPAWLERIIGSLK